VFHRPQYTCSKLGVATALPLDDRLFDPDAIPNSYSFHLAKGSSCLDLCPAYDEDESDDGSGKDMTTTEAT
jgi:hypothetical protein